MESDEVKSKTCIQFIDANLLFMFGLMFMIIIGFLIKTLVEMIQKGN